MNLLRAQLCQFMPYIQSVLKKMKGEGPEVYIYDELPKPLKIQIVQIWTEQLGVPKEYPQISNYNQIDEHYKTIVKILRREYGVNQLTNRTSKYDYFYDELNDFFSKEVKIDRALDVVELTFSTIKFHLNSTNQLNEFDKVVRELNFRFEESGVGYRYESERIISINDELIHREIVKPALRILTQPHFAGAQEEFLKAHEFYRNKQYKDSLNNCLKSFESVMKAICDKRGWQYDNDRSTAQALINICVDNGLIPKFWESHYSSLRSLLESGVPTGRNRRGGHGQGTAQTSVPDYLVAYMLHLTATTIVFLAEAEKELQN